MGLLGKLFGKKPKVPEFVGVDMTEQQRQAIAGNRAIVGDAGKLALEQQEADQAALLQGLKRAIPGYEGLVGGQREIIEDMLAGRVSQDVADRMADRAAARGISTGMSGSQALDFRELRNYGLTSMQQQEKGLAAAGSYISQQRLSLAPPMSVTSMFMSPAARLAHAASERSMKFQRDMFQAKIDAAPDPRFVGVAKIAASALGGFGGLAGAAGSALGAGLGMAADQFSGPAAAPGGYNVQNNIAAMDRITAQNQGGFLPQSYAPNPWAANIGGLLSSAAFPLMSEGGQ